jgi:hypothetical protein
MMARHLTPIGILCAIVGGSAIASLATGKTLYVGSGSLDGSGKHFFDRSLEPTSYWISVAVLLLPFGGLLFATLSGAADR